MKSSFYWDCTALTYTGNPITVADYNTKMPSTKVLTKNDNTIMQCTVSSQPNKSNFDVKKPRTPFKKKGLLS